MLSICYTEGHLCVDHRPSSRLETMFLELNPDDEIRSLICNKQETSECIHVCIQFYIRTRKMLHDMVIKIDTMI